MVQNSVLEVVTDIDNNVKVGDVTVIDGASDCSMLVSKKSFNIALQNIRSIQHNFNSFQLLLEQLNINTEIILLTECRHSRLLHLPIYGDYNIHSSSKIVNQNSGIVVYYIKYLNIEFIEPIICDAECLIVKVDNNTAIICIYRSPSVYNIDAFLNSLDAILNDLKSLQYVYLFGDLNIDIKSGNTDSRSNHLLDLVASHGLLPGHLVPTHTNNCIDHCFAKPNYNLHSIICEPSVTDHSCLILSIPNESQSGKSNIRLVRQHDFTKSFKDLETTTFDEVLLCPNADEACEKFSNIVTHTIDKNTTW